MEANARARKMPEESWKNLVVGEVNRKHGTQFEAKWLTRAINNPKGKYHKQLVRLHGAIERLSKGSTRTGEEKRGD
jgi:hypothetical protein